jgi:hypothetical protein
LDICGTFGISLIRHTGVLFTLRINYLLTYVRVVMAVAELTLLTFKRTVTAVG